MRMSFTYNGRNSLDLDVRIRSKNIYSAPKYDVSLTSIPGRNGDLPNPNGRFGNGSVSYTCFVPAKSIAELGEKITAVKNWLYADIGKYHVLTDSYDSAFERYALFNNKLDISDEVKKIGVFTVNFSVKPFRYMKTAMRLETHTEGFSLYNPFVFTAKPYIKVNGRGSGTLTIQSAGSNKVWQFDTLNGYTECDSELMNFYHDTELKNDTVHGDGFPELLPGTNMISFGGGITSVEIIPRWMTL